MRLRRHKGFHGLKRPVIRQSWNKFNLYNLQRYQSPVSIHQNLFKQKWVAKSLSRKYHGETLGERHWKRQFRPTVRSVVTMFPEQLAANDGRAHAAGRGSGHERPNPTNRPEPTPYANMVYAALERRLEVAVFRALFASSTRQARQMCIHGFVKVNGQTMVYPAYQLNPGDLFQVDPERVMHATGAPKDIRQARAGRVERKRKKKGLPPQQAPAVATPAVEAETADTGTADSSTELLASRKTLQELLQTSKIIATSEQGMSENAKYKQALRDFTRLVKRTLSRTGPSESPPANAQEELQQLMTKLNITVEEKPQRNQRTEEKLDASPAVSSSADAPPDAIAALNARPKPAVALEETQTVLSHQHAQLMAALSEARDNPIDPSKPYGTPWRPRPYMSPFAFIPRYLEVHPIICSAVYVRHPVARAGLAEVPTPFESDLSALVHNWYLRRR